MSTIPDDDPSAWDVRRYLKRRGVDESQGWFFKIGVSDDPAFIGRVVIPSFDAEGMLNFYTARTLTNKQYGKYLNASVNKTEIIFNEININWQKELTVTEGPFDLLRCNENATCILGSELNEHHFLFQSIIEHGTPVVLALDDDKQERQEKIAELLTSYNIHVRILDLGHHSDVGEMSGDAFDSALAEARVWDRFNSLLRRIRAL